MRSVYALQVADYYSVPASMLVHVAKEEFDRVAQAMREQDRLGWIRQVEEFMTALGVRCLLEHVTEGEWLNHFERGDDPFAAVFLELERID